MYWNESGYFIASKSLCLYFTWALIFEIFELNTHRREYLRKNKSPTILITFAYLKSTHRLLKSAMVHIDLFTYLSSFLKSS